MFSNCFQVTNELLKWTRRLTCPAFLAPRSCKHPGTELRGSLDSAIQFITNRCSGDYLDARGLSDSATEMFFGLPRSKQSAAGDRPPIDSNAFRELRGDPGKQLGQRSSVCAMNTRLERASE